MALFPDKTISSLAEFITELETIRAPSIRWFRGQARLSHRLVPSLARLQGDWLAAERTLTSRFEQNAAALVPAMDRDEWDWLLLMQHYGVPTRLLDWTENPLAALYFATLDTGAGKKADGALWVLDPMALNRASAVSLRAVDIPILGMDEDLEPYSPQAVATAVASLGPVAVLAKRQFPRLVAQSGVFTVVHRDRTPLEALRAGEFVGRLVIPSRAKVRVADELGAVGVTRLSLFPELESAAATAKAFLR